MFSINVFTGGRLMYLTLKEITDKQIIQDSIPENFYEIGYDLTIRNMITPQGENNLALYELHPGTTVFISTEESVKMPNDVIGKVIQKNSLIRKGLQVEAPVYQPGHHTRLFLRVTNISSDVYQLKQGQKIAAIMFEKLPREVSKYSGSYVDEFEYRGVAEYPTGTLPQLVEVEKKMNDLKEMEDGIVNKVIAILGVFIGIFTLINLNIEFVKEKSLWDMIAYNLTTIGSLGIFTFFVGLITMKNTGKKLKVLLAVSVLLIAAACFVVGVLA